MVVARPVVPGEVGVEEDADLAGFGLLHGVDHAADERTGGDVGAQSVLVAAHGEMVARVIGARPVDPHEGGDARLARERLDRGAIGLAPHAGAGHDGLHVRGQLVVPVLARLRVVCGDERDRVLETRILGRAVLVLHRLQLVQPVGEVVEQLDVVARARIACVVGTQHDLTAAGIDDLQVLRLQDLEVGLVAAAERDRVVHERMQRVDEAALRIVAGLRQRGDLLDLLIGIQRAPLGVMLGIVLGSVDVGVLLVVAAPAHQLDAVLGAPGITVIALDEAAGLHVRPVVDGQGAHRAALDLLENLEQRAQTVESRVGVATQNHDARGRGIGLRLNGQIVGVGLGEKLRLRAHRPRGRQLVDGALRAADADEHLGARGVAAGSLRLPGRDVLQCEHLVEAAFGLLVDAGLHDDVHGVGQRHLTRAVLERLRSGVHLVCLLGHGGCRGGDERRREHAERRRERDGGHGQGPAYTPSLLTCGMHTHPSLPTGSYNKKGARAAPSEYQMI